MRRLMLAVAASALVALTSAGLAAPVAPEKPRILTIGPLSSKTFTVEFKGRERASAIVTSKANGTYLGLYVYDRYGNCVAWDDLGSPETTGAASVDWFPAEKANYVVEVRNNGSTVNDCKMIVR
jgi:hypothetical protein